MPWWIDNKKLDFPRGYHIEVGGGLTGPPGYGFGGGIQRYPAGGGYGKTLKNDYRRYAGAHVYFAGRGEMVPNDKSYCEIDPVMKDKYGIPVLRFHWQWSDYEYNQVRHMQQTFRALVEQMGGQVFDAMPDREKGYGIARGGEIIHELGTTRMGANPATSVLDANSRAHDVKNLFVTDGGPFVSQADKNPTWTIMALSMRTSDFIARESKRGAL
jgi:choline dehydrogenase-like flavoprotein